MTTPFMKYVSWGLITAMFIIGIAPRVHAEFASSEIITCASLEGSTDLDKVQKFFERKMIVERLKKLGFTKEEVQERLGQLNDQQVNQLALKIDDIKVGNGVGETIIVILLIAILVVLLLQLTGHKIIVTK